ncbi:MAG: TonB-dependent receptor, partial [Alloprevotella sp.]|nr:TonB-dependent receptor [Alloprevotella sp.]
VRTPAFADLGLKLSYAWRVFDYSTLTLSAGVQNVFNSYQSDFDQGPDRDSGYIYGPSLPRSLFVGLKLAL